MPLTSRSLSAQSTCVIDVFTPPGKGDAFGVQAELDVFALQDFLNGRGYIFVFSLSQAWPHLDDGYLAAKPAEHLPELQADIAATYDDQVPRKIVDVHDRAVGEVLNLVESRHLRHGGAATDVDEDPIRRENIRAHAYLFGRLETSVAFEDAGVFQFLQRRLQPHPRLSGYGILPRLDAPHIDAHTAVKRHSEVPGASRHVGGIGARHHGFGWDTAGVDTRSAE